MFCPKCASAVVPGQRFCRNCGLKLDVIVDAIEGKSRAPFDFEMLKRDLRDLGASLRAGFEGAGIPVGKTQKLNKTPTSQSSSPQAVQPPPYTISGAGEQRGGVPAQIIQYNYNWSRELNKALRKVKAANTRKYSLQQAVLNLLGGGAMMTAWYYAINGMVNSGLIESIQRVILNQTGEQIDGIIPFISKLWLLALIPIARGTAHLINGIFIVPKKTEEDAPEAAYVPAPAPDAVRTYHSPVRSTPTGSISSGDSENEANGQAQPAVASSVTEDETLRLEPR